MSNETKPSSNQAARKSRPKPASDPDRIMPPKAAELVGLSYPEQFNVVRWSLEEGVDPATGEAIPIPAELRVEYLTTAQLAKLDEASRANYRATKAERLAWTRMHWMRVPCWGGVALPGGEYRYSATLCREWAIKIRGIGTLTAVIGGSR